VKTKGILNITKERGPVFTFSLP